jgi:hypothetical protein
LPGTDKLDRGTYNIEITAVDEEGRETSLITTLSVKSSATEGLSTESGFGTGTLFVIMTMVMVVIIVVFGIVRITKRTPR